MITLKVFFLVRVPTAEVKVTPSSTSKTDPFTHKHPHRIVLKHTHQSRFDSPVILILLKVFLLKVFFLVRVLTAEMTVEPLSTSKTDPFIHKHPNIFVHKHTHQSHFDGPVVLILLKVFLLKVFFLVRVLTAEMTVEPLSTSKTDPLTQKQPHRIVQKHTHQHHFDSPVMLIMLKVFFLVRVPTAEMMAEPLSTSKTDPFTHKHPHKIVHKHTHQSNFDGPVTSTLLKVFFVESVLSGESFDS